MSGSVLFPNSSSPSAEGSLLFGSGTGFQGGSSPLWKSPLQTPADKSSYRNGPGLGAFPTSSTPAFWLSTPAESNVADAGSFGGQSTGGFGPSPSPSHPQSLLYRDLAATPPMRDFQSSRLGDSQATAAAAAALWRESVPGPADPPPPPCATLEDQVDRLLEGVTPLRPVGSSPDLFGSDGFGSPSPFGLLRGGRSGSFSGRSFSQLYDTSPPAGTSPPIAGKAWQSPPAAQQAGSLALWSYRSPSPSPGSGSLYSTRGRETGALPVAGVVPEQGALLTLPPPREVVRPPAQPRKEGATPADHWITVFGFGPDDINTVLREFEKCGPMVDHVYGPGGANWIHIQYQSPYDAQRALSKNGLQLSPSLIVGVKPMDSLHLQSVTGRLTGPSGTESSTSLLLENGKVAQKAPSTPTLPSARPYYIQPKDSGAGGVGIAQPTKSSLTKFVDFIFGM